MTLEYDHTLQSYYGNEVDIFNYFVNNGPYKWKICDKIEDIMFSIYGHQPNRWSIRYNKEGKRFSGIVEIIGGKLFWGHLNRFNTNYTAITHAKHLLDIIEPNNGINFDLSKGELYNVSELNKFLRLLEKHKDYFFSEEKETYWILRQYCINSWIKGLEHTKNWVKHYENYLNDKNVIGIESYDDLPGEALDMFDGFDCITKFQGKNIVNAGTQIKGVKSVVLNNEDYWEVRNGMGVNRYPDVKLFVFYVPSENCLYVFKNDISKMKTIQKNGIRYVCFHNDLYVKKCDVIYE